MTKPYRIRFNAGPLHGQYMLVHARDELDAAGIVGRELGELALYTSHAILHEPGAPTLFGPAQEVPTITLEQALEALNADAR